MLETLYPESWQGEWPGRLISISCIVCVAFLAQFLFVRVAVPLVRRFTRATPTVWDDYLLNDKVMRYAGRLIPPVIMYFLLTSPLHDIPEVAYYVYKCLLLIIIVITCQMVFAVLGGIYEGSAESDRSQEHPLQSLYQMLKLVVVIVGVIIGMSTLLDKNPMVILTGLGASAAVLMLVFKDTILGLVAGIQLSVNKMLRVGDWITIPSRNANGVVRDVTLTTVKVQNFDNTIITIPPYSLISESFQNWDGMKSAGARRVMRPINIDLDTVRFCTAAELRHYESCGWLHDIDVPEDGADSDVRVVNLLVFRRYVEHYLSHHPDVVSDNPDVMLMVRQLDPTPHGLPVQLYFFTSTTEWKRYEYIAADIFDHVIAMVGEFGLRIYQYPTGTLERNPSPTLSAQPSHPGLTSSSGPVLP